MTRPTHRQQSAFTATAADLPLFSGTAPAANLDRYDPKPEAATVPMFDRREYISKRKPAVTRITVDEYRKQYSDSLVLGKDGHYREPASYDMAPETNAEARQQAADDSDEAPALHYWRSEVHQTPDGRFAYTVTATDSEENAAGSNYKTREQARRAATKAREVCNHADRYRFAVYNGEIKP